MQRGSRSRLMSSVIGMWTQVLRTAIRSSQDEKSALLSGKFAQSRGALLANDGAGVVAQAVAQHVGGL